MTGSHDARNSGFATPGFSLTKNPTQPVSLPTRQYSYAILWLAVASMAAGCMGGSGSSGFDIAEGRAIQRVVDQGECEVFDGLTICPADTGAAAAETPSVPPTEPASPTAAPPEPTATAIATSTTPATDITMPPATGTPSGPLGTTTPTSSPPPTSDPFATATAPSTGSATPPPSSPTRAPSTATATAVQTSTRTTPPTKTPPATATATVPATDTPTPTTVPRMEIVTNRASFADQESVCATGDNPEICFVQFEFVALGFPADTSFRIAARPLGTVVPWSIFDPTVDGLASPQPIFVALIPVELPPASSSATERLQIVVLGFESDPGPVPGHVDRLSDTGADLAFAVEPLPILTQ